MKNYKFISLILVMITAVFTIAGHKSSRSCEEIVKGIRLKPGISISGKDQAPYGCYVTIQVDSNDVDATINSLRTQYKWAYQTIVRHRSKGRTYIYLTQFASR